MLSYERVLVLICILLVALAVIRGVTAKSNNDQHLIPYQVLQHPGNAEATPKIKSPMKYVNSPI